MKQYRKLLAMLLSIAMLASMVVPMTVSAAEDAVQTTQVESAAPSMERTMTWDFASAAQLSDFSLYQSATSRYNIVDGVLASDGLDGELKAIVNNTPENLRSVSVNIIPGASGQINAGLYIGASNATNQANGIQAHVFQIQSNFTGWSDAPNRIDIIHGQFNNNWEELGRTVSEAGNGNALFSKGNKEPLNLKLTFSEDVLLLTLSLVSNPNKFIHVMYEMDATQLTGQVGLRVNASDAAFDQLSMVYAQPLTEYQKLWDFSDAAQSDDFTLYTNGNDSFVVADGMLKANGGHGEMKAIFNEDMANISAMSVDIIPGPSGLMNAGVYVGAKNVSKDQDKADAIAVMIESMFSGWEDAPNRVDLWLGKFNQGWGGEIASSRLVSETGNRNALYSGGVKQPLNLKLEFGTNTMTATLSLMNNPNRFVQKTWTMTAEQLQGQIGLRNQFIDLCYDNLLITYKQPVEHTPETETAYENQGYNFFAAGNQAWEMKQEIATPYTLEAWVKVPQGIHDSAMGYIVGNHYRTPYISMQMIAGGKLRLAWSVENADLTIHTKNFDVDTDLRNGKWTHVAFTCDVASDTVVGYINGEAVQTWNNAGLQNIVLPDHIFPDNWFMVGSTKNAEGDVSKHFPGWIADVRLWHHVLSVTEIGSSMNTQYTTAQEGLLFNAPLTGLEDGKFADLSGNGNDLLPNVAGLVLEPQTHEAGSYSMVVIPDPQILNHYNPELMLQMYQWIADNREKENIQIVMCVGDMIDNCGNIAQWDNNQAAVELLGDLPFIVSPGNHDYDTNSGWDKGYGVREQLTYMNQYLPRSLFESYSTDIGFFDEVNSANQWQAFSVNGNHYLVIALEYVPQDDVIAWANEVVESHPNHQVIMVTHSYMGSYGNVTQTKLWNNFLNRHENIIMDFSGHVAHTAVVHRTDKGIHGNDVHQILMDAQMEDVGGQYGMVGILRFNADGTKCDVSYYSTLKDQYESRSNFTLNLPKKEQNFVAQVNGISYESLSQAIANGQGQTVKLLEDCNEAITIQADTIIDLDGFTLTNVTVAEGATLQLIDSAATYEQTAGAATIEGKVAAFAEANGKTYLTVGEDGIYTAHPYHVEITHISLDPAKDALGYKAKLSGDAIVQSRVTGLGFNLWLAGTNAKTYTTSGKQEVTLRLKNILASNGGQKDIYATAFVTLSEAGQTNTKTGNEQSTTMQKTLQLVNSAWTSYNKTQKDAVKALCDKYFETVSAWELDNIYPVAEDGSLNSNYEAVTGAVTVNNISGFTADGKLAAPNNGEGKVILNNTPTGNKTISVELHPKESINSAIYLGASNADAPQDSVNAIAIIIESSFADNPNRADIVIGNFPAWKQHHRYVIEGANALFTNGVKEPVKLTVQQNGNELIVTLALISNPSKSATTTYTYDGAYDLENGQVGLRSQYNDCAFDNFQVNDVTYTFDNEASTDGLSFYHSAHTNGIQAKANNSLILHASASFTEGTYAATMNTAGKNAAGIVFGADEAGERYHLFRITGNQMVELVKVDNGIETVLDKSYLSAGHIYTNDNRLEIVKNGNTVYCYYYNRFDKVNCYAVNDVELAGDCVGMWAAVSGTIFRDVTITKETQKRTAETLIFGHSYTEMWWDYETYFPEYTDIDDIGIGGSVAAHWESLTEEIISYQPSLGIYDIGINDLTGGTPPKAIIESMEKTLLEIKAALPEFEVVLVSVSHCPARSTITATISQTNALMRNLAASYDWMYYAEAEYMFCTDPSDPLSTNASLFIDGLHPSAEGYQMMAAAIRSAANGENQPAFDESLAKAEFEELKAAKLASLNIYGEKAYTAENWVIAKPSYDAAVAKIEACTSLAQLKSLNLSAEVAALQSIRGKSADLVDHLLNPETRDEHSINGWSKTNATTVNANGYSYALDNTALYADSEIVFKASDNTGKIATGGVFLRAKSLPNKGIQGYLINYVTGGEYLQVYYVNNVYNTDGSGYTLKYIGGINYAAYGQLIDTEFYAKIEGSKLYVNTLTRHMAGQASLIEVDLTNGGEFAVFESGYTGILSWNNGVSFNMQLSSFAAEPVAEQEEGELDIAQQLIENLLNPAKSTRFNTNGWSKVDSNTLKVNGFGYSLDNTRYTDASIIFKASNNSGNIATGGVFLRATANANGGVDGYLINYVTEHNFIQVFYLKNVYNQDQTEIVLEYLGGIVFNDYGDVTDTEFYAQIEGDRLYINTVERFDMGQAWLANVDLTNGGAFDVYESGSIGVLSWNDGVSFDMTIDSIFVEE